jgi:hypothetical protein
VKTIDVGEHFTELDRSVFQHYEAYIGYFKYVRYALNCMLSSLEERVHGDPIELQAIRHTTQQFLNTLECLSYKYAYEDEHLMRIDLTESGFPNHMEIRKMEADLELRKVEMAKLPEIGGIKSDILDYLIAKHDHPRKLLKQIGKSVYLDKIGGCDFMSQFNKGKLILVKELEDVNQTRRFSYSWSSYDSVTNRPFIYVMVFDNPRFIDKKSTKDVDDNDFDEVIKKSTHNSAPLKVIAADIDAAFEAIFPKVLKRIDLGPLFGIYSQDEHLYTRLIKTNLGSEDFVMSYTTEVLFSVGEKRTSSFLSKGDLRQIFFVDESNKECMDRMVSEVHNYMISSHKMVQLLNDQYPDQLKNLSASPYICKPFEEAII